MRAQKQSSRRTVTPYTRTPSRKATRPTPLADADQALRGTLVQKHIRNDNRIERELKKLVPKPKQAAQSFSTRCQMSATSLCLGKGKSENIGRYYRFCTTCDTAHFITPFRPEVLEKEPLRSYLRIREELRPIMRTPKTGQSVDDDDEVVIVGESRGSSEPRDQPSARTRTADFNPFLDDDDDDIEIMEGLPPPTTPHLDAKCIITVMVWTSEFTTPLHTPLCARKGSTLVLSDHKLDLGKIGLEIGLPLEKFMVGLQDWRTVRWDTPIVVKKGEVVLLRLSGLRKLVDWEIHATHVLPVAGPSRKRSSLREERSSPLSLSFGSSPLARKSR